jgi:hypothetical protein
LKEDHQHPDWKKGIPRNYIKEEYHPMLANLQRFLTCEDRYVVTFIYHLRLLLHFEGGPEIDFPYFLWMSLIQVDIDGHPPFLTGSKLFSGNFGNLLFLAGFNFQGHFEGPNEGFSRSRFSMIAEGMIEPPK